MTCWLGEDSLASSQLSDRQKNHLWQLRALVAAPRRVLRVLELSNPLLHTNVLYTFILIPISPKARNTRCETAASFASVKAIGRQQLNGDVSLDEPSLARGRDVRKSAVIISGPAFPALNRQHTVAEHTHNDR